MLNLAYASTVILLLYTTKAFFNGATYLIPNGASLHGKYAVVTGGNSGIGA
jgi:hypothetical protein